MNYMGHERFRVDSSGVAHEVSKEEREKEELENRVKNASEFIKRLAKASNKSVEEMIKELDDSKKKSREEMKEKLRKFESENPDLGK